MKLPPYILAIAAAGTGLSLDAAGSELGDKQLAPVSVSIDREQDIQARTELGRLNEYTPISGAVVKREELEHLQLVNNLLELGKRVPGISLIRNMRIPDGGKLYTENRVDGMRGSTTNTSILDEVDMADIEQIEVITGPASAIYGSGAFGGTISVITRQPPKDFKARVSQEAGSWGFRRSVGNAGASFADGRVSFIVTGSTMDNGGWRKNSAAAAAQDAAAEHKNGITVRTQIRPTDSTKITVGRSELMYDFRWAGPIPLNSTEAAKLNNTTNTGVAGSGTSLRSVDFDTDWQQVVPGAYGQYIDHYTTTSLRLQQLVGERGEFTLARTRIVDDGINNGNGGSGGANHVICDNVTVTCNTVNSSTTVTNTVKKSYVTTETTLAMYRQEFDLAKLTAYAGAETVDVSTDSTTYNNAFTALQGQAGMWAQGAMTTTGQGSLSKQRDTTPFVHFEFSPIDRLRLHIGQRFARTAYNVDDRKTANKDVVATVRGRVLRTGLTYDLGANHLIWANRGETFNPQAATTLVNSDTTGTARNIIGATLKPEEGVTHELGFRGQSAGLGLRYDLTFFYAVNRNYIAQRNCSAAEQAALNGGASCLINENVGGLTTKGLEAMASWAPTPWLDLGATYTNSRVFFNEYVNSVVNYTGKDYQSAPRNKINLRAGFKPAPGWLVELEADHISRYYMEITNQQGSYARPDLFNLRTSYKAKDWSAWLHVVNLTDRKYATRAMSSTVAGKTVLVAQAGQGNAGSYTPLTIRAGVSFAF